MSVLLYLADRRGGFERLTLADEDAAGDVMLHFGTPVIVRAIFTCHMWSAQKHVILGRAGGVSRMRKLRSARR
jgi:hypothetical protein